MELVIFVGDRPEGVSGDYYMWIMAVFYRFLMVESVLLDLPLGHHPYPALNEFMML